MVRVTKQEVEYLKQRKLLKLVRGRYPDLVVANREHKGRAKSYYINENLLKYLVDYTHKK